MVHAAQMVSDTGTSSLVGRRLGTYQVEARLGAGGMGEVYRARDTKLGRDVAIKILPRAFTSDQIGWGVSSAKRCTRRYSARSSRQCAR